MSGSHPESARAFRHAADAAMLHLGNYHGALKNWIELQYQYECYFFIADWHALTTGYEDTSKLEEYVWTMAIDWLAAGLNPGVATLFIQSKVPEHAELHLLLSMITPLGWLERVPSYKDQQAQLADQDLAHLRLSGLSAAAVRRHPAVPRAVRAGGRRSGRARGNHARDGAALQSHLRTRAGVRAEGRKSHQEPGVAQLVHVPHRCARSSRKRATATRSPRRARWSSRTPA